MKLYPRKLLPFDKDKDGLLPWVIGVMVFLCMLSSAFSSSLTSGLRTWSSNLSTTLSVQILEIDDNLRAQEVEAALKLIKSTPGVQKAEILAKSDVLKLLSPWLGDIPVASSIPIPTLIDITLYPDHSFNADGLRNRLSTAAPSAKLDDHQSWIGQIIDLASLLRMLLFAITVMIVMSTIAIVIFGCRNGLASHRDYIAVMHLIGAEDEMIAKAFDRRYFTHGLIGGFAGGVLAAIVLAVINILTSGIGQSLIQAVVPTKDIILWLMMLPVAAALLSMATAHITVMRALAKML